MSVRPITDTLRQIAGGEFIDKSSDMMAELVRAVDEQGGQGSITLKITVKRATASGAMTVTGKATLSKPAEAPMEATDTAKARLCSGMSSSALISS